MTGQRYVIAYYNAMGYEVLLFENGEVVDELGQFGNNRYDSYIGQSVDPSSKSAVPLRRIRSYAIKTGKEIAEEQGVEFAGVERDDTMWGYKDD
jgi:hypothetical protein